MKIKHILLLVILASLNLSAQTGHWEKLNPTISPSGRFAYGMTSIDSKKVMLFGGNGYINSFCCASLSDTWLFDLNSKEWTQLFPKISPPKRTNHRMCQISEKRVLLFGGDDDQSPYYDDTWIFDLTDTTWTKLEPTNHPNARSHFGLTRLNDSLALLFGGRDFNISPHRDTWIFNSNTKEWKQIFFNTSKTPIPYYRIDPALVQLEDGKVLLFGGFAESVGGFYLKDTWIFDIKDSLWMEIKASGMTDGFASSGVCNLNRNKLLVFGGEKGPLTNDSWIFDYQDSIWSIIVTDTAPKPTMYIQLAKIDDGKALLFGGWSDDWPYDDTWIFSIDSLSDVDDANVYESAFEVSPNPASDFIEISVGTRRAVSEQSDVKIFNVYGQTVLSVGAIHELPLRLDISGLPPGMYFVRIGDKVGKFVKL